MFSAIYVERAVYDHPAVERIVQRFHHIPLLKIERYGEIFNRRSQNFRLQKLRQALILARKNENYIHVAPDNYGLGGKRNYYFSHMLNCIYDCRYCFLQGMYRSANYVLFVNYEDFASEIRSVVHQSEGDICYFYSGYDCDSLALEPVTQFVDQFLPVFSRLPNSILELRTKSTQIRNLLERPAQENVVIAFSFTPDNISTALEYKVASVQKRITAMKKLQQKGWLVGLRFDPLIYEDGFSKQYAELFEKVFSQIDVTRIHSVSLGAFRLPESYYRRMQQLYPNEMLFAARIEQRNGMAGYSQELEASMIQECENMLLKYIAPELYFPCSVRSAYAV